MKLYNYLLQNKYIFGIAISILFIEFGAVVGDFTKCTTIGSCNIIIGTFLMIVTLVKSSDSYKSLNSY